jgi:hypothetical protein
MEFSSPTQQQIRYRELVQRLSVDFPDVPNNRWDQYLCRWKKQLNVTQPRRGWYDWEDYVGLRALGTAYRRLSLIGEDARDYAFNQVEKLTNGY